MSAGKSTFREIRCLVVSWTGIGGRSPLSFGRSFRTGAGITRECDYHTVSRLSYLSKKAGPK